MANLFQNLVEQEKYIKKSFSAISSSQLNEQDQLIIYVNKEKIVEFLTFLRDDELLSFKILLDLFGLDMLGVREPRFEVVYNLLSLKLNNRIIVKVALNDGEKVNTVSKVFSTANWLEREAFDMFGIEFENHPDHRRILTDYGFEGHPLRKDFPLTGYKQIAYDKEKKKVVYESVNLRQEYRDFDFEMPWKGTEYEIKNQDN
jgi:NADH-quinone oxidoreductase subunit C